MRLHSSCSITVSHFVSFSTVRFTIRVGSNSRSDAPWPRRPLSGKVQIAQRRPQANPSAALAGRVSALDSMNERRHFRPHDSRWEKRGIPLGLRACFGGNLRNLPVFLLRATPHLRAFRESFSLRQLPHFAVFRYDTYAVVILILVNATLSSASVGALGIGTGSDLAPSRWVFRQSLSSTRETPETAMLAA